MRVATKNKTHVERLGARIRDIRKEKDLTQADLAKKLGRSQSQISEWETGDSEPQLLNLIAIAKALGVQLTDLVS
jgi:transcriptional regulator with XRE-family HTH domain